jgi:hypothetical protein
VKGKSKGKDKGKERGVRTATQLKENTRRNVEVVSVICRTAFAVVFDKKGCEEDEEWDCG